jgi:hypothetical protein
MLKLTYFNEEVRMETDEYLFVAMNKTLRDIRVIDPRCGTPVDWTMDLRFKPPQS